MLCLQFDLEPSLNRRRRSTLPVAPTIFLASQGQRPIDGTWTSRRRLRHHLDALGPALRAELLHPLMPPDLEGAERIGEFWSHPQSRTFAE
jgi:hypothetical protein